MQPGPLKEEYKASLLPYLTAALLGPQDYILLPLITTARCDVRVK